MLEVDIHQISQWGVGTSMIRVTITTGQVGVALLQLPMQG
jgi:hypothetical protein